MRITEGGNLYHTAVPLKIMVEDLRRAPCTMRPVMQLLFFLPSPRPRKNSDDNIFKKAPRRGKRPGRNYPVIRDPEKYAARERKV